LDVSLDFEPRPYQRPVLTYLQGEGKRACLVWHRRAGKDLTCWNWMILSALRRVGTYYYFFPTYRQGQKILWYGIDGQGKRFIDYIPRDLIVRKHETDMRLELLNGSFIQVVGVDNIDNLVGTNIMGAIFSEYSVQDPKGWQYMSPVLRESGGWAIFVFTPRGNNHGKRLWDAARNLELKDKSWFTQMLTVGDTMVLTEEDLEAERASGIPEELIQQEYFCSWNAQLAGAFFGQHMDRVRAEKRICQVPYDPRLVVHTAWDIGVNDPTSIWFFQKDLSSIRVIDYHQKRSHGMEDHVRMLRDKPYNYGQHFGPHDMRVMEFSTGRTRVEMAADMGIHFDVVPKLSKEDQINAARSILPICYFDEVNTMVGIESLEGYQAQYDDIHGVFKPNPIHNQYSHGADAFQVMAVGSLNADDEAFDPYHTKSKKNVLTDFDVRSL
jgi:phage terminase large subunit